MNRAYSVGTFLKNFESNSDSVFFVLNDSDQIKVLSAKELQREGTLVFFHDTTLLIEDFIGKHSLFPSNIADIGTLAITIESLENKSATVSKIEISRLLTGLTPEETAGIDKYFSAFWGNLEARNSENFAELIRLFLVKFQGTVDRLFTDEKNTVHIDRFIKLEQPISTIAMKISAAGILFDSSIVKAKRNLVEKKLYSAIKELSNKTNLPLCFPNDFDKIRVLKQLLGEKIYIEQLDNQIDILSEAFEPAQLLKEVSDLQRELQIFKRLSTNGHYLNPIFETFGTTTGRILCKDPELQNISKSNRDILVAPPGHTYLYVDYDQFEAGILASLSGCPKLIELCNSGDVYLQLAKTVFNDENARPFSKVLFLAFSYGMELNSLKKMATIRQSGSASKLEEFFQQFDHISAWKRQLYSQVLADGSMSTIFGGKKTFKIHENILTPKQERSIVSHRVQGSASVIFKDAMLEVSKLVPQAKIVLPMHDALLLLCHIDRAEMDGQAVIDILKKVFKKWCPNINPRASHSNYFKDCL